MTTRYLSGEIVRLPVADPEPFGTRCSACGEAFNENSERAEVVNTTTEARSVVHVECYLADRCCYALA